MKRVWSGANPVLAGLLHSVLEVAGIRCLLRHQYLAGALGDLPPQDCWPQIWVLDEEDASRAEWLLARAQSTAEAGMPAWICPGCGETLEGQFEQCWACGARR